MVSNEGAILRTGITHAVAVGDASLLADFAEVGRGVDVEQLHDLPLIQIRVVYKLIRWKGKKEVRLAEVKDETFADFFQSVKLLLRVKRDRVFLFHVLRYYGSGARVWLTYSDKASYI